MPSVSTLSQHKRRWLNALLLLGLFLLALAPRLIALRQQLPYVEHVDEPALVETVVRMVRDGDPNPRTFIYPSLQLYFFAAATRLQAFWGMRYGLYTSLQDLPLKTYGYTTSSALYLWNRTVTALLGAAAIPLLYLLGRRMFDRRVGLLGALLLAVATFHVEHSHYITTDAPTGLWVTLALIGAWRVATGGEWTGYIIGSAGAGLAAGTKYNAGVVALALPLAHVLYWRRASLGQALLRLVAAGVLTVAVFLLTTPYALLDWRRFVVSLRFNAVHYASVGNSDFFGRWRFLEYARFFWDVGLLPAGSIVALLGLPLLARGSWRQTALLLSVLGGEIILLMTQVINFVRNLLPVFPLAILVVAAGAVALADLIPGRLARRVGLVALGLAVIAPQLRGTVWMLRYWSRPYTLNVATGQLRGLPRGMRAAVELNAVAWANDPIVFPVGQLISRPLSWYRANGFRYLVINSDRRQPGDRAAYESLQAAAKIIARYPERRAGIQPGPGGAILDLGEHVELMRFARREARFGDRMALLGYELQPGPLRSQITALDGANSRELRSGAPLQINLYWRALVEMDRDYTLFVHIVNAQGQTVAQRDLPLRYGDYPTSRWQPGELVIDRADLPLPALPPGAYRVEIGVYDGATGAPLPGVVDGAAGAPVVLTTLAAQ